MLVLVLVLMFVLVIVLVLVIVIVTVIVIVIAIVLVLVIVIVMVIGIGIVIVIVIVIAIVIVIVIVILLLFVFEVLPCLPALLLQLRRLVWSPRFQHCPRSCGHDSNLHCQRFQESCSFVYLCSTELLVDKDRSRTCVDRRSVYHTTHQPINPSTHLASKASIFTDLHYDMALVLSSTKYSLRSLSHY